MTLTYTGSNIMTVVPRHLQPLFPVAQCLFYQFGYWSIKFASVDPVDNTYLWFIIPQLLNGLSSLLVSMTSI